MKKIVRVVSYYICIGEPRGNWSMKGAGHKTDKRSFMGFSTMLYLYKKADRLY